MMTTIDFSPLYRSTVGFDRLASLVDNATQLNQNSAGYPPYNIEKVEDNRYGITLAVAGFTDADIDITTEAGVLTVRGKQSSDDNSQRQYLHQGIANRSFERKFQLADHVEVSGANLANGLLTIDLVKEVPEALKPKKITIGSADQRPALKQAS